MDERTVQIDATMTIGRYMTARFTTLKPPMDKVINPITALRMLTVSQWAYFMVSLNSKLGVFHLLLMVSVVSVRGSSWILLIFSSFPFP